ncbi:hypothetical protein ACE6H2_004654 [Prunus campanulata]
MSSLFIKQHQTHKSDLFFSIAKTHNPFSMSFLLYVFNPTTPEKKGGKISWQHQMLDLVDPDMDIISHNFIGLAAAEV